MLLNYSKKQYEFAVDLLKRIGFYNLAKINQLLVSYELRFSYVEYFETTQTIRNRKGQVFGTNIVRKKKIKNDRCIDLLINEVDMRREINQIEEKTINLNDYITATDLSNFVFCNASFSISKSYNIIKSYNIKNLEIGTELHQYMSLAVDKEYFGFKSEYTSSLNNRQKHFLNRIKSCKLIFKGHDENRSFFVNPERNFKGQPDYIFLDSNNDYFVIEEKFHYQKINDRIRFSDNEKYRNKDFYLNNLVQLQSYIDYIKEYDIKYGVLINWYYFVNDEDRIEVNDFTFKILRKDANKDYLNKIFDEINGLQTKKRISFNNNVNIKKCFNCSVNLYCGHKTDNFSELEFPYKKSYLKLKYID